MISRFLLLSFDYVRPLKDPNISLAAASIMAHLSKGLSKIRPKIQLFHRRLDVANDYMESITDQVIQHINDVRPQVIGTGVYVWNESYVSHTFQRLSKRWPTSVIPIIVLGGPQITYSRRGTLDRLYPYAQAFIRGYAEQTLLELIIAINSSQKPLIKGVHYLGDKDMNQMSEYSLKGIPSPLLSGQTNPVYSYIRYETKRGCAFKCRFCQHKDSYGSKDNCDIHRIQREIQWIADRNINDISIVDPIFNLPNSHYLEVMDIFLDKAFKGRLNLQTRLEMITEEFVGKCGQLLNSDISIELECGLQTVNRNEMQIIDRPQSKKRIERKAQIIRENNIPFEVSLIYGLPMQTLDTFKESIDFVTNNLKPNRVRAWPLMLLKGTELYEMKSKFNLREKLLDSDLQPLDDMRQYTGIPHVISSNTFNENDWIKMKELAQNINSNDLKLN